MALRPGVVFGAKYLGSRLVPFLAPRNRAIVVLQRRIKKRCIIVGRNSMSSFWVANLRVTGSRLQLPVLPFGAKPLSPWELNSRAAARPVKSITKKSYRPTLSFLLHCATKRSIPENLRDMTRMMYICDLAIVVMSIRARQPGQETAN